MLQTAGSLAAQYSALLREQELIASRIAELKSRLTDLVKAEGFADDKGSIHLVIDNAESDFSEIVYQRRVTKKLDMNTAEDILSSKDLMERCIIMQPALDEQEIMAAYAEDLLDDSDIDMMFPASESWAFTVKKK